MLFKPDILRYYNQLYLQLRTITNASGFYIFNIIENGAPISVGEIVSISNMDQPIVSQAISKLRKSGFISNNRKGKQVFYSVNQDFIEEIINTSANLIKYSSDKPKNIKEFYTQLVAAYRYLKSLLNQSRLVLLEILNKKGRSTVSELKDITEMKQSLVSQNLILLKTLECVLSKREGKNTYYSLNPSKVNSLVSIEKS